MVLTIFFISDPPKTLSAVDEIVHNTVMEEQRYHDNPLSTSAADDGNIDEGNRLFIPIL